ncbi:MAG: ROK family protein [Paracoccaceae bacterium]|nr:ROK family protein [Paracoccaceae bacterium]MDG1736606.1 ROK family protein [Paracoccaceae bacterium]MDG2257319.1 ROK family protein [Paracoccaceae bacterium]
MIAFAGIDLGGTKSEAQLFDANWRLIDKQRVATPDSYQSLVKTVADQVKWSLERAGQAIPVGIGAPGLVDDEGKTFTANLPAKGKPFPADIAKAAGHSITYVNDCRALALSEAAFGAGQGYSTVMSLIIGTGVGGGVVFDGHLRSGPSSCGGEFGHMAASAAAVGPHGLQIHQCGCGRIGCVETYIAGPGLVRLAQEMTGKDMTAEEIGRTKDQTGPAQDVWNVWLDVTADLLLTLIQAVDPDIIVLGGGLSKISNVTADLTERLSKKQISGFGLPSIVVASGGDASGARGAALAAAQENGHV